MLSTTKATLSAEAHRLIANFDATLDALEGLASSKDGWIPMSIPPKRTGKYLVGHRGHQEMNHFLANDHEWHPTAKLGWQGSLDFGPTHWLEIPEIKNPPARSLARSPKLGPNHETLLT
jgi:hypothetical protein